jgi:hypothetical protein
MAGWCFNGDWRNIKREHLHMPICDLINAYNERWKFRYWTWSDETAGYTFGASIGASLLRPTYSDFYNLRIEHLYNVIREIQGNMWRLFPAYRMADVLKYNLGNKYTQALQWVQLDAWESSTFTPANTAAELRGDYSAHSGGYETLISNRTDNSYPLMQLKEILGNMRYYGCNALSRCIATTDTPSNIYDYTFHGVSMMKDSHGNDAVVARPETRHYKGLLNDTITPSGSSAPYAGGYKLQAHPSYSSEDAGSWMSVPDYYALYPRLYYTAAHTMTAGADIDAWVDAISAGPTVPSQFYTVALADIPVRAVGFRNGTYRWLAQHTGNFCLFGTPPKLHAVYYYYADTYEAGVYANDLTLSFRPEFVIGHKHIMTRVKAVGHAARAVLGHDNPHTPESVQFDVAGTNITVNKPAGDELRVMTNHEIEFPGPSAFPGYGDNELNVTMNLEEGDIDYFYGMARERWAMQLSSVHTYWDATEALAYYNEDYE